jgi:hypothetical protein
VSKDKRDRKNILNFENNRVTIKHNQSITPEYGVWNDLFRATEWYRQIITRIISVPEIESIKYIQDPSQ